MSNIFSRARPGSPMKCGPSWLNMVERSCRDAAGERIRRDSFTRCGLKVEDGIHVSFTIITKNRIAAPPGHKCEGPACIAPD